MIANHKTFIEAINTKRKVRVRFYSVADSGVVDRVCVPLDYGPGTGNQDGLNRYWLWDDSRNDGSQTVGLLPKEIVDLQLLGEPFDPAQFTSRSATWLTPRDWGDA